MIAKISNISNFNAALKYVVNKQKVTEYEGVKLKEAAAIRIGGNLVTSKVSSMSNEFNSIPNNLKHPGKHLSISLPIGETVNDEKWLVIAKQAITSSYKPKPGKKFDKRNDYSNCQWVAYRHSDTKHQHIHIIINRKDFQAKTVLDKQEKYHFMDVMRELELKHDLTIVKPTPLSVKKKTGEIKNSKKNPLDINIRDKVNVKIKLALDACKTSHEIPEQLKKVGIEWKPRRNKFREITGARFHYKYEDKYGKKEKTFAGNKVGFSLQTIEKLFEEKKIEAEHSLKKAPSKKLDTAEFVTIIKEGNHLNRLQRVLEVNSQEERKVLYDEFVKQKAKDNEQLNKLRLLFTSFGIPKRPQKEPKIDELHTNPKRDFSPPNVSTSPINVKKSDPPSYIYIKIEEILNGHVSEKVKLKDYLKTIDKETLKQLDYRKVHSTKQSKMRRAINKIMKRGMSM